MSQGMNSTSSYPIHRGFSSASKPIVGGITVTDVNRIIDLWWDTNKTGLADELWHLKIKDLTIELIPNTVINNLDDNTSLLYKRMVKFVAAHSSLSLEPINKKISDLTLKLKEEIVRSTDFDTTVTTYMFNNDANLSMLHTKIDQAILDLIEMVNGLSLGDDYVTNVAFEKFLTEDYVLRVNAITKNAKDIADLQLVFDDLTIVQNAVKARLAATIDGDITYEQLIEMVKDNVDSIRQNYDDLEAMALVIDAINAQLRTFLSIEEFNLFITNTISPLADRLLILDQQPTGKVPVLEAYIESLKTTIANWEKTLFPNIPADGVIDDITKKLTNVTDDLANYKTEIQTSFEKLKATGEIQDKAIKVNAIDDWNLINTELGSYVGEFLLSEGRLPTILTILIARIRQNCITSMKIENEFDSIKNKTQHLTNDGLLNTEYVFATEEFLGIFNTLKGTIMWESALLAITPTLTSLLMALKNRTNKIHFDRIADKEAINERVDSLITDLEGIVSDLLFDDTKNITLMQYGLEVADVTSNLTDADDIRKAAFDIAKIKTKLTPAKLALINETTGHTLLLDPASFSLVKDGVVILSIQSDTMGVVDEVNGHRDIKQASIKIYGDVSFEKTLVLPKLIVTDLMVDKITHKTSKQVTNDTIFER